MTDDNTPVVDSTDNNEVATPEVIEGEEVKVDAEEVATEEDDVDVDANEEVDAPVVEAPEVTEGDEEVDAPVVEAPEVTEGEEVKEEITE